MYFNIKVPECIRYLVLNHIPPKPPCIPLSTPSPNGNANNASIKSIAHMSKYNQLLLVLDELNKDVRPAYAGSKASVERLRRGISHARLLVHESLIETERGSRNWYEFVSVFCTVNVSTCPTLWINVNKINCSYVKIQSIFQRYRN